MYNVYKFEADNPDISVNIFVHSEGEFYPVHSTNLDRNTSTAGLLLTWFRIPQYNVLTLSGSDNSKYF